VKTHIQGFAFYSMNDGEPLNFFKNGANIRPESMFDYSGSVETGT
jgi:hypothetical protein